MIASTTLLSGIRRVRESRLIRQNLILALGGVVAGIGGFVYHAIAGRVLGPQTYGEVASLVAIYTMGTALNLVLVLVLARSSASLIAEGSLGGLRGLLDRSNFLLAAPTIIFILLLSALAPLVASFEHLSSPIAVIWLSLAIGGCWYMALPRGILQGSQLFTGLSLNLAMEMILRTVALALLLAGGLGVNGSMVAIIIGVVGSYLLGRWSLHEIIAYPPVRVRMRTMAGFALTAAGGTVGILLLYNLDVVLASHYLDKHGAGIYGGLNKIGVIIYFGTLSVSQVLFPRVVEAIASHRHPGRLLLLSVGLTTALGLAALAIFALAPQLVVNLLFGAQFRDAQAYLLAIGAIGLGLSLNNLLVQFLVAVHDWIFLPLLGIGCALEGILIVLKHAQVGAVVNDVLLAMWILAALLAVRSLVWLTSNLIKSHQ